MKTQDNEFDDLFSKKLNDLEMEPSANVWAGIDAELNAGQRKRKLTPILSIAASIVILITAGILFIPRKGSVDNTKHGINRLAHNPIIKPVVKPQTIAPINVSTIKNIGSTSLVQINNLAVAHRYKKMNVVVDKGVKAVSISNGLRNVSDQQTLTAAIPQKPDVKIKPVVPDLSTPLMAKNITADPVPDISSKPVLAAATPSDQAEQIIKKHRVRNIGDLVNLVVDKVDKRKNKIIVFSDTDDDESTVTALNVGPIKINKDNK